MNYLSHFVYNHDVRALPEEPYFIAGVALPDLWPRFSRRRRIRWSALRAAQPADEIDEQLRGGLLNHADADASFHTCPLFLDWVRQTRQALAAFDLHPSVAEFLAHVAVELTLDHHLVRAEPALPGRFYRQLEGCAPWELDDRVGRLAAVAAHGLGAELSDFISRRFLPRYADLDELPGVLLFILGLTRISCRPPLTALSAVVRTAAGCTSPTALWPHLLRRA